MVLPSQFLLVESKFDLRTPQLFFHLLLLWSNLTLFHFLLFCFLSLLPLELGLVLEEVAQEQVQEAPVSYAYGKD